VPYSEKPTPHKNSQNNREPFILTREKEVTHITMAEGKIILPQPFTDSKDIKE